jgi:hypothetical protein
MPRHKVLKRAAAQGGTGAQISPNRYDALRQAILAAVPKHKDGVALAELTRAVAARVPRELFKGASLRWYTTAVKLDLEAEGLIERAPGFRPQRLRRVQKNRPHRPRTLARRRSRSRPEPLD